MNIIQDFIPPGRKNRPGRLNPMHFITIHNTGNTGKGANAKSHTSYVKSDTAANAPVSWHYTVDETAIYQHLPDNEDAFHAGDGSGDGNRKSIGIEICMNSDGDLCGATDNAVRLTAHLCKKHDIPIENIVQHHRWSGKNCPQMIRNNKPYDWNYFIAKVKKEINSDCTPLTGIPIMGTAELSADCLSAFLLSKNPEPKINCSALELARFFIEEGNIEGVRSDIAFCQSLHETGWFKYGGDVKPEQNNFSGIGTVGGGAKGAYFKTPQEGVRAQIQHLKAYASKEPLKQECVDPRFSLVNRGTSPNWEDLNGRWAVPGTTYGQSILKLYESAKNFSTENPSKDTTPSFNLENAIDVLVKHGVINSPDYWLDNYEKMKYLDDLIINMAKKLIV